MHKSAAKNEAGVRERLARKTFAGGRHRAITQAAELAAAPIQTIGEALIEPAGQIAFQQRREPGHLGVVGVVAGSIGCGVAVFCPELADLGVLPVDPGFGPLDGQGVQVIEAMLQRGAVAFDVVARVQIDDAGRAQGRHPPGGVDLGVLAALLGFESEAQLLSRIDFQDGLAQQVTVVVVHRVGGCAIGVQSTVAALVAHLATLAVAAQQQALPTLVGAGHAQGVGPGPIHRGIAGARKAAHRLAGLEQVDRVERAEADGARQAIAAELGGRGASQHLDGLDSVHIEVITATGGQGAERETVGHADAVDQHQHLVALQPPDVDAFVAGPPGGRSRSGEAGGGSPHGHTQLVAEHVFDVAGAALFDAVSRDDCHGGGHLVHPA